MSVSTVINTQSHLLCTSGHSHLQVAKTYSFKENAAVSLKHKYQLTPTSMDMAGNWWEGSDSRNDKTPRQTAGPQTQLPPPSAPLSRGHTHFVKPSVRLWQVPEVHEQCACLSVLPHGVRSTT